MTRHGIPKITTKMKEIAKKHDPKAYIEKHNDRVNKKLVVNQKLIDARLDYLFAYLNH